ncbi:MFS transporter [Aureimonas sp. SA4125]|uniref:MFS transporter n=1 Tax=Aureimonas sp. SA4125 TaxID=2826993 RepID=UPI001CC6F208|nr:MFS transporter [Aureimonas sp. SA4125]BDA84067.1 MFS transporter [Aureimonas sp. SA4125]
MTAHPAGETLARRNAVVLAAAQALVGAAAPITIASGGLAGFWLLGTDKAFATLPVTGFNIGIALGALPAAALMRIVGRKHGFVAGACLTATGGLAAATALFQQDFWLFALALLLIGIGGAFVQQYRFAATDGAPKAFQARAIATVLVGGIFAAVIGPQAVRFSSGLFLPTEFAGAFVAVTALSLAGALVLHALRDVAPPAASQMTDGLPARPLADIVRQPKFLVALVCGVGTYSMMSFVMTGAPLAIVGCGFSQDIGVLGIQWHVLAMFAPSFFTGRIIARFGKEKVVATGLVLIGLSAAVALEGLEIWNFWLALILLGLGWNFGFIGSTAMVAETYRLSERNKTQGMHDFILFSCVALSSFLSGRVLVADGWQTMNMIVFPVVGVCLLVLLVEGRRPAAPAMRG